MQHSLFVGIIAVAAFKDKHFFRKFADVQNLDEMHNLSNITLAAATALLIVSISLPSCHRRESVDEEPVQNDTVYPLGFCTDSFSLVEGTLKSGEIFTGLMTRLGMTSKGAMELVSASDSVFDPRKLRAGNQWQAYYNAIYLQQRLHV